MRSTIIPFLLAALLAAGCGSAAAPGAATKVARDSLPPGVRVAVAPGADIPLDLPAESLRLVLELRSGLATKALPAAAASVVVTVSGDQLTAGFSQTITAAQFVSNTAQVVISGLNAGTYKVTADVKDAAGAIIVTGYADVGVVAGQATSAKLVLIYGAAAAPGGINASLDLLAQPVAITSVSIDPATVPGPGYPARVVVTTNKDRLGGLRYRYSATGGRFTGTGASVLWIAPQQQGGAFTLTATVIDGANPPVSQDISATVSGGSGNATGTISFANFS